MPHAEGVGELTSEAVSLIRSIAVIGAGDRGRAFALRCVQAGFTVSLEDVLSSNLRKAEQQLAGGGQGTRLHIHPAGSIENAVRNADLAIDFVPDELESKLEIFSLVDRMAPPRTILCTPTRLSITDLASCTYRAALCLGVDWVDDRFSEEVRLTQGQKTSDVTVERVSALFRALGATVQVVKDAAVL